MTQSAAKALSKFTDGLMTTLLKLRDKHPGELLGTKNEAAKAAFDELYYSTTVKNCNRFIAAFPEATDEVASIRDSLIVLTAARKAEIAADKERRAVKRARAVARASHVTSTGVRLGIVTRATYDNLSSCMAGTRAEYVARYVEHYQSLLASFLTTWKPDGDTKQPCLRWIVAPHVLRRSGRSSYTLRDDAEAALTAVATKAACLSFDSYLIKLAAKIAEPVIAATVSGSLWSNSSLIVTTATSTQLWHTKCILNRSILGKLFNQFPTRLITNTPK